MYFKSTIRKNPDTGCYDGYYRLVESYRNMTGRVCHRTLLNVGFMPQMQPEQLNKVRSHLMELCRSEQSLFKESDEAVNQLTKELWNRLITEKRIDIQKASRMINADTMQHSNVREIGAEWMTYNVWHQLQLPEFLETQGWKEEEIQLAATQLISRAVYPASELSTSRWIKENSAVCELTGYKVEAITRTSCMGVPLSFIQSKASWKSIFPNAPTIYLIWMTRSFYMTSPIPILKAVK